MFNKNNNLLNKKIDLIKEEHLSRVQRPLYISILKLFNFL